MARIDVSELTGGNVLGRFLFLHSAIVVALVERREVKLLLGLRTPEPDVDAVLGVVSRNRHIVGHGQHTFSALPVVFVVLFPHPTAEANVVRDVGPLDLEGVAVGQPVIRNLDLVAIDDLLLEDTVFVTNTVAPSGVIQSRKRV